MYTHIKVQVHKAKVAESKGDVRAQASSHEGSEPFLPSEKCDGARHVDCSEELIFGVASRRCATFAALVPVEEERTGMDTSPLQS